MGNHFDRALILYEQSRPDLAERELKQELAAEPSNAMAHALLGLCLSQREEYARATEETQAAVGLAPDLPFPHYALASVMSERNRLKEAMTAIEEALRMDAGNADYYALQAGIRYQQNQWDATLEAAERGLEIDAEHVGCNNLRAMALVKLGRKSEAGATIEQALAADPENALTHANQGWALLEQNRPKRALEHFREALRIDPELEWARAGIVEALKARNIFYRAMLKYFLWMAKLSTGAKWAVILGGYFGQQILSRLAKENPALEPFVLPIIVLYMVFVLATWLAYPFFNLLLHLNPFGRLALSRDQRIASVCLGLCLLIAVSLLAVGWLTGHGLAIVASLYLGLMLIPLAGLFYCQAGWPRLAMGGYIAFLAGIGITALLCLAGHDPAFKTWSGVYFLGALLSTWVVNILSMARVTR